MIYTIKFLQSGRKPKNLKLKGGISFQFQIFTDSLVLGVMAWIDGKVQVQLVRKVIPFDRIKR